MKSYRRTRARCRRSRWCRLARDSPRIRTQKKTEKKKKTNVERARQFTTIVYRRIQLPTRVRPRVHERPERKITRSARSKRRTPGKMASREIARCAREKNRGADCTESTRPGGIPVAHERERERARRAAPRRAARSPTRCSGGAVAA